MKYEFIIEVETKNEELALQQIEKKLIDYVCGDAKLTDIGKMIAPGKQPLKPYNMKCNTCKSKWHKRGLRNNNKIRECPICRSTDIEEIK